MTRQIGAPRKSEIDLATQYILRCREEPIWFAEETLRHRRLPGEPSLAEDPTRSWELDRFQQDLLNAVADVWRDKTVINHERQTQISVVSGHGPGKTHTAGLIAHYFTACWPARVIVTAPKFTQVRTRLFAAIHKIDMRAEPWYRRTHEINATSAYWFNEDGTRDSNYCILGETAKNPENLQGHHETYQLVIVEEATGVPEALFPAIFGALSTGVIQILLMISNGTQRTGTFADSHLKARESKNYFKYQISFENSARVSRKWAQRLIEKYGRDSPIVKVRVFGEFASDDPGQVISMQWIIEARNADPTPDGSIPRRKISIDVAAGGDCENVLTLGIHYQSKVVLRRQKSCSFEQAVTVECTANEAERMWRDFELSVENGDTFIVDVLGPGIGVAGELLKRGYPVVFHQGGAASADPKRWRNQRVQAYLACRNTFRDHQLVFDEDFVESPEDWDDIDAQLCAICLKDNNDRLEDLETKREMKDRLGFSPDRADSISMQWSAIAPTSKPGDQLAGAGEIAIAIPARALEGLVRG